MRRHPADWTYRSLAAFEKLQHIPHDSHIETVHYPLPKPVGLEFRIRSLNRGLGHHCVAPEF